MKQIETERLILRPLTQSDANAVFEWAGDPLVNRYMPYPLHKSPADAEEWIRSLGEKNEFCFCLKNSGKIIGSGSVIRDTKRAPYELGYNLNRAYWGMGYATEAAKALVSWAYESLGARDFFRPPCNCQRGIRKRAEKMRVSV